MIEKCIGCNKVHDHTHWKSWFENGKIVYLCALHFKPTPVEFVPQSIRDERAKYLKSQIQSHRQGEVSKEFTELYPEKTKEFVDAGVMTQKEVDRAKPVWTDLPNINHVHKTE